MGFVRVRLQARGDRVKPGHDWRQMRQHRFGRLKSRLIELRQNIDVITGVDVLAEHLAIVLDFHQPIALLALRAEFGQAGHEFAIGAVQNVIFAQGASESRLLAFRIPDRGLGIEAEQRDHLFHQLRGIAPESTERIARRIGQTAAGEVHHKMARILERTRTGQMIVPRQLRQERIFP